MHRIQVYQNCISYCAQAMNRKISVPLRIVRGGQPPLCQATELRPGGAQLVMPHPSLGRALCRTSCLAQAVLARVASDGPTRGRRFPARLSFATR